jgi:SAM-dependent methyltransferase
MFQKYGQEHFRSNMRVLEIGPDAFPSTYQTIIGDSSITWDTVDLGSDSRLTYTAVSEYTFPIADNSYDLILSGQVIEHVRRIWVWMKELARVCKAGGTVITINPVSWPYHEHPVDCWRAYPEGIRALYGDASLEVILSKWESLEAARYRRAIPGRSPEWQPRLLRRAYAILGRIGFPVECAFDTITIGKKIDPHNLSSQLDGPT